VIPAHQGPIKQKYGHYEVNVDISNKRTTMARCAEHCNHSLKLKLTSLLWILWSVSMGLVLTVWAYHTPQA